MISVNAPEFARNYGFWNEAEQEAIINSSVALAGAGGDGFQLGTKLARMGVSDFSIADPEVFEPENSNRVPGAANSTYGLSKVEVLKSQILDINPDATVRIFDEGVTPDNVQEFMSQATLCFDESELTHLEIGTAIAREARRRGIPNVLVMNIGFSAIASSFHPNSKHTFERVMGVPKDAPLDEVKNMEVDFSRCLPYVPAYGDLKSLEAVQAGASLPSIAQGVDMASALGSTQGFLHIVSKVGNARPEPVWAPRVAYMDAYNFKSGITRFSRPSHYRHLAAMLANNVTGRQPKASYTEAERSARQAAFVK